MKFLVFQHVPHEHPGLIGKFAHEKGFLQLDVVELWKPFTIPDPAPYKALIIMGGPMGVYEDKEQFPSKDAEIKFIQGNIGKLPMIGFCLGAQLLAHALGAAVYPNTINGKFQKEIGYYDTYLTQEGQSSSLFKGFTQTFTALQWHGDTFDIPKEAVHLASSTLCKNQAFSYQNIFGIQFHCEFTTEMIKKQIEVDNQYIHENFTFSEAFVLKQAEEYATKMEAQNTQLFNNFLKIIDK
jgi:GMP synthase (glutamine-hydrolysing)